MAPLEFVILRPTTVHSPDAEVKYEILLEYFVANLEFPFCVNLPPEESPVDFDDHDPLGDDAWYDELPVIAK
ncbi:MAG: hypothetical protein LBE98_00615 [Puniceicoccales bacterium]|jgi:hypothetical protein|nr:hypothetical protein [Puniceicoccales bacterium]